MRIIVLIVYMLSLVCIAIGISGLAGWPITLIAASFVALTFVGWEKVYLAVRVGIFNDGTKQDNPTENLP